MTSEQQNLSPHPELSSCGTATTEGHDRRAASLAPCSLVERGPVIEPPACAPLNFDELLERCMGRLEFAERILASFERRLPVESLEIAKSLEANDLARAARLTHQLKGTAANICAPGLLEIVKRTERAVRDGQPSEAARLLGELDVEWKRFITYRATIGRGPETKLQG
jgi:HPt (histidine-containing phosphotransfer) domain-containing protein